MKGLFTEPSGTRAKGSVQLLSGPTMPALSETMAKRWPLLFSLGNTESVSVPELKCSEAVWEI